MPSTGRTFITNKVPFEHPPLSKDGRFTRPWHDYFEGLSNGLADFVLYLRESDLIGAQVGAEAFGVASQTLLIGSGASDQSTSGTFVPVFLAAGDTFTVPEDTQALFAMTMDIEGTLVVDGYLVQVN